MQTLFIITLLCIIALLIMAGCLLYTCKIRKEAKAALPTDLIPTQYFLMRTLLGTFYLIIALVMAALAYYGVLNILQTVLCGLISLFLIILGAMVIRHYSTYIILNEILTNKQ